VAKRCDTSASLCEIQPTSARAVGITVLATRGRFAFCAVESALYRNIYRVSRRAGGVGRSNSNRRIAQTDRAARQRANFGRRN